MKTRGMLSLCLVTAMAGWAWAQDAAAPAAAAPAAAAAAPVTPGDPTLLLKALPADAAAFAAIPDLAAMDANVQGVLQQLQLAGMVPGPLDWIKSSTGVSKGLKDNGSLAFALLSLKDVKTPEEIGNKLVVYIPATKSEELIEALGGEKDGDVYKITLMGQPSFGAPIDGFVIAAEKAETVKAALAATKKGLTLSPTQMKRYPSTDLFVWINPSSVSKELQDSLREALQNLQKEMSPVAASQPAAEEQWAQMFNDLQECTVALSLSQKTGLVLSWFFNPRDGSKTAKQMETIKAVDGSLLKGLPKEPTIGAMGFVVGSGPEFKANVQQGMEQAFTVYTGMLKSLGIGITDEQIAAIKTPAINLITTLEQGAVSVSGLPEGDEGRLAVTVVAKVADGKAWQKDAHKLFDVFKQIVIDAAKQHGEAEEKIKPIADAFVWKENAEQVDGATVDHFTVDIEKLATTEQDKAQLENIKKFVGKEGLVFRFAATSENHVIFTFGGGAKRFAQVIESAKKGDTSLSESASIKSVAGRLPKGPRVMEGYLSLDTLLETIMSVSAEMGSPIPIPLALRNAAPIAVTVTKPTPSSQAGEVLVPMELMVSVKELVGPLMMMMGGGMQQPPAEAEPAPGGQLN